MPGDWTQLCSRQVFCPLYYPALMIATLYLNLNRVLLVCHTQIGREASYLIPMALRLPTGDQTMA